MLVCYSGNASRERLPHPTAAAITAPSSARFLIRPVPAMTVTRPSFSSPQPLLSNAELRALETQAAVALPPHTLMARAGAAAAQWLAARVKPSGKPVWFAIGPGNNGGDALIAAAELQQLGIAVTGCMPIEGSTDDARWALAQARAAGVQIHVQPPATNDDRGWIVDGLFGIGLTRPLDGIFATLATRITTHAQQHGQVLALDVPSGLNSDTGAIVGGHTAVTATHTLTFLGAKPGLYMAHGRDLAGEITVATLAPLSTAPPPHAWLNAPALFAEHVPLRTAASHKGTYGSLAIIGGDTGMCGAPILAARAALHTGAGKVHVGFVGADAPPYDSPFPELMLHRAEALPLAAMTAFAIGCGLGTSTRSAHILHTALQTEIPALLDADALNLLAITPTLATAVSTRGVQGNASVLTPHPLEAARLLDTDTATIQRDRLAAARALAARFTSVIVLKGAGTVIAAPDGRLAVNPTGNAALATGGTGDVLSGIIAALLAQRLPRYEAALAGVYLHGLAAETLSGSGPAGLTAGELATSVRALLNQLFYPPRTAQ